MTGETNTMKLKYRKTSAKETTEEHPPPDDRKLPPTPSLVHNENSTTTEDRSLPHLVSPQHNNNKNTNEEPKKMAARQVGNGSKRLYEARAKSSKNSTPPKKMKKMYSRHIIGKRFTGGIATADICWTTDPNHQAYFYPFEVAIKQDSDVQEKSKVYGIYSKRHPDIPSNCELPQDPRKDTDYAFKTLVRVYERPDDNTTENLHCWLNNLKSLLDIYVNNDEKTNWPATFEVVGDASPQTLEPPTHHLLNEDVMEIIMETYPTLTKEELAESVASEFFGTWKDARDYILTYDNTRNNPKGGDSKYAYLFKP